MTIPVPSAGVFKVEAEPVSFEFDLVQLTKADDQAFVRAKFP